ncbi:hypothetical protein [uncultured Clostridium sp.]|uniref:hypothetical protein n=1 Tax=uncultured Clostridium sp. TaxID=59620 RepID=UPI0028EE9064|nr:hypothetical protein [uncultured Clostridium sp.]
MLIGIKYCGGCNPKYNRQKILSVIKDNYRNLNIKLAEEDEVYDLVIVLCGCTSCCADHKNLKYKYEKIIVKNENDYSNIVKVIENINK